jgi:hypothetical protein
MKQYIEKINREGRDHFSGMEGNAAGQRLTLASSEAGRTVDKFRPSNSS